MHLIKRFLLKKSIWKKLQNNPCNLLSFLLDKSLVLSKMLAILKKNAQYEQNLDSRLLIIPYCRQVTNIMVVE